MSRFDFGSRLASTAAGTTYLQQMRSLLFCLEVLQRNPAISFCGDAMGHCIALVNCIPHTAPSNTRFCFLEEKMGGTQR